MFCNYLKKEFCICLKHAFLSVFFPHMINSSQMVLNREVLLGECSFGSLDIPLKEHHSSRHPFKDVYSTFPSSQIHLPHLGSLNTPFCTWWHRLWDDLLAVPGLSLYRHTSPPVGILLKYIPSVLIHSSRMTYTKEKMMSR